MEERHEEEEPRGGLVTRLMEQNRYHRSPFDEAGIYKTLHVIESCCTLLYTVKACMPALTIPRQDA